MKNVSPLKFASFIMFALLGFGQNVAAETYAGGGVWHKSTGEDGTHTASVSCTDQADGSKVVTKTFTMENMTMNYTFVIQPFDTQFFKIWSGNQLVGGGYCWDMSSGTTTTTASEMGGKLCHANLRSGSVQVEETMKFVGTSVFRMGSKYDSSTNAAVTWKDKLDLVSAN